jgi:phosphoribosylformylglycinamidine synthase subunit PurS
MKFIASINIMPLKNLSDPQGQAVNKTLKLIGFEEMQHVRIGKHISLEVESSSKEDAMARVNEACKKLLTNPRVEGYEYSITKA